MKYIWREKYIERIKPFIGNGLIKILVGQRRVGKSYLLRQVLDLIKDNFSNENIIFINKEDIAFDNIVNYLDLITYVENQGDKSSSKVVFIDEIQEIESFEKALRHLQASGQYDIYCTGSNAQLLSSEIASKLADRFIQIRVYSLSYREFLQFHRFSDSNESIAKFMTYGGMPYLINLNESLEVYSEYHKNIYDSIILRDIISRYKLRNIRLIQDLITFLADNLGNIVSANKISDYLKSQKINVNAKTIIEYLSYIESVFVVDRVKRADVIGKKIFEIGEKFYFEDLGIRNNLIPFKQKDIAKVLENIVYHHLKVCNYDIKIGKLDDREIDFIAERSGYRIYIQVAYLISDESTHNREFGNLLKIEDNWRKIVISMDEITGGNYLGIEHWNIRNFLMKFE